MPSLLRLLGFGLILATAVLVISNTGMGVGDDTNHHVRRRALAMNYGGPGKMRDEHVWERPLRLRPSPRILNGRHAAEGQFPYLICMALQFRHRSGNEYIRCICGGSVLSEKWVLSVAHCFVGMSPDRWSPDPQKYERSWFIAGLGGDRPQPVNIVNCTPHERWGGMKSMRYDAILCEVDPVFEFGDTIRAVRKLPSRDEREITGEVTIVGYGSETAAEYVSLTAFEDSYCEEQWRGKWWKPTLLIRPGMEKMLEDYDEMFFYNDSQWCAGHSLEWRIGHSSGDSGSPAVQYDSEGTETLVGMAAWGHQSRDEVGSAEHPGVQTRVSALIPWIERMIPDLPSLRRPE